MLFTLLWRGPRAPWSWDVGWEEWWEGAKGVGNDESEERSPGSVSTPGSAVSSPLPSHMGVQLWNSGCPGGVVACIILRVWIFLLSFLFSYSTHKPTYQSCFLFLEIEYLDEVVESFHYNCFTKYVYFKFRAIWIVKWCYMSSVLELHPSEVIFQVSL